jgi:hypothetical protein
MLPSTTTKMGHCTKSEVSRLAHLSWVQGAGCFDAYVHFGEYSYTITVLYIAKHKVPTHSTLASSASERALACTLYIIFCTLHLHNNIDIDHDHHDDAERGPTAAALAPPITDVRRTDNL